MNILRYLPDMRRFELVDGTSSKFWEIDTEGARLTIRFGRIGSAGQTKSKELASAAKAETEAAKLVAEKTGKGYIEIASANPATEASTTTPRPARPEEEVIEAPSAAPVATVVTTTATDEGEDEGTISFDRQHFTKKLHDEIVVVSWRNAPAPYTPAPKPLSPAGTLLAQLRAVLPKVKAEAETAKGTPSSTSAERMARVYGWKSIDELDVELAANAFALFRNAAIGLETLVRTFVAAKGLAFALEALVRGAERGLIVDTDDWPYRLIEGLVPFAEHEPARADERAFSALENAAPGLYALRRLVAGADDANYASVVTAARRLSGDATNAGALAIAVVLSEETELVDAAARAILAPPPEAVRGPGAALVLTSLRNVELGRELFTRGLVVLHDDEEDSPAWTMIARLGVRAGSILAAVSEDQRDDVLTFLEAVRAPASFRALLSFLGKKSTAKSVQRLLLEHPKITAAALAPVLAQPKHADHASAKVLAAALAKARPDLDLLAAAPAASAAPSLPLATEHDLPAFLVEPPWSKKAKASADKPEKIELEVERVPLSCTFEEGDLDALAAYSDWGAEVGANAKSRTRGQWEQEIAEDHKYDRVIDLALMFVGPEDLALAEWNDASDERRLYYPNAYYGGAFAVALARRGVKFAPGLLKLLRLRPSGADRMPIDVLEPVLLGYEGTEVAELFIDTFDSGKKIRAVAETWSRRHPETMAKTAIPIALAGGKRAANAIALLQSLVARDRASVVDAVARAYEGTSKKPVSQLLDAIVGTDPLAYVPAKLPKLPDLFTPKALPPIVTKKQKVLPPEAVMHVGTMLAISGSDAPYAGLRLLREACTEASLREFTWALFESWMATGSPPKEMWILHALGFLGDDETARRLTPMIRAWPGERAAARAVEALGVLANIGTDLALMLLNGIAEKVRFASIQEGARARIAEIAKRRGLTAEELGDRLVPDLGLDVRGETTLDFGPRSFRVGFDEHLQPFVVDPEGKKLGALPKPGKNDDASKAKEATDRFKALKKDVAAISRMRIERLQATMISRRRWDESTFRMLFVDKPLVLQLARRLVWGAWDSAGKRSATFRVDLDRALSHERDEAFTLPEHAMVGVVHPFDLSKEELTRWGQLFADYEIVQPFPQIGREVFRANDEESKSASLAHEARTNLLESRLDRSFPAPKLVFGLEKLGWKRGGASDGGSFSGHWKDFVGTDLIAHVEYDGAVGMGYIDEKETLTLSSISFERQVNRESTGLPIGDVDAIVVSEVLRDLSLLEGA